MANTPKSSFEFKPADDDETQPDGKGSRRIHYFPANVMILWRCWRMLSFRGMAFRSEQ